MTPVLLTKIKSRDGITLDGIYVKPERRTKTALVWLHGLSSRFSSGQTLIRELSQKCRKNGIGYLKFNNRGHDIINKDGHGEKRLQGACFEKFENCVLDIRAVINFAKKLGYKNIILAGHSTGANKALYYIYKTLDRAVKGLILLGPINDIVAETKRIGKRELNQGVKIAHGLKKKNPFLLMPQKYGTYDAKRYLSLYDPGSKEDVFPYHNPKAEWKELKSVRVPTAVIVGSRDEHSDRPAKKLIKIFQSNANRTRSFSGVIIKGANHGFYKKEKELAGSIISWINNIL